MESARDRLLAIQERMAAAAARSGRSAAEVTLLAVTKTVPLDRIRPFLEAGITDVGENRVQEAMEKYSELRAQGSERPALHLIGQLQSNKAKKAVGLFNVIQSLDRWELAEDLNRHAAALGKKQACLIEVKISSEESKSGLPPEQLESFIEKVGLLPHLEIRGLMGIAPLTATPEESRPHFRTLRRLFDKASAGHGARVTFNVLSMGMSSDFEVAIEEGSTMVRLGTVLFGQRRG